MSEAFASQDEANRSHWWERRHRLMFTGELSQRYHRKRERFFAFLDRLAKAVALIGGTTAAARALQTDAAVVAGFIVAVTSAFALVFAWGDAARRHGELAADCARLLATVTSKGETTFQAKDLDDFESKLHELAAKEPAQMSALVRIVHNEMCRARNENTKPLSPYKRYTAHFIDWQLGD